MLKKHCTIFVLFALLLCFTSVAFATNSSSDDFYTEVQENYKKNYTLLNSLGIFSEDLSGNIHSDKISKIKAYEYALELLELDDVSDTVSMSKAIGFIKSESDYRPNGKLTQSEAARIFVSVLGYSAQAETKGGSSTAYFNCAKKIGLFENVKINSSSYISYADFYTMIVNSLEVELFMAVSFSNEAVRYEVIGGETILSRYFDIDVVDGIVTENDLSSFYLPVDNGKGALVIGNKTFWYDDSHAYELLGHRVKAYVVDENDIIYATPHKSSEFIITNEIFGDYTGDAIIYYPENSAKSKKAKLSSNPIVLYNDVAYPNYTAYDIENFEGELLLIDNNDDEKYDIIKIYDYTYGFVDTLNVSEYAIRFLKPDNTYKTFENYNTDEKLTVYNSEGKSVLFSYILDKDFVSIAESKTKHKCRIVIHRDTLEGIAKSRIGNELKIDDNYYKIAPFFEQDSTKLTLGSEYKFYLDNNGRIVGVDDISDTSLNYGFIIATDSARGLEENYRIKLINTSGEIKIHSLADKVRLDGRPYKSNDVLQRLVMTNGSDRQLIKYRLNSNDEIAVIDTVNQDTLNSYDTLTTETYTRFEHSYRESYDKGVFDGRVITNKGATFFVVPKVQSENPSYVFAEEEYMVGNTFGKNEKAVLENQGDYIDFADISKSRFCNIVVYYKNVPIEAQSKIPGNGVELKAPTSNPPLTVREIVPAIDENGEEIYKLILEKQAFFSSPFVEYAENFEAMNYVSVNINKDCENILWKNVYDDELNIVDGAHKMMEPGDIVQFSLNDITGKPYGSYVVYDTSLDPLENAKLLHEKGYAGYGKANGYSVAIIDWVDNDGYISAYMSYDEATGNINTSPGSERILVSSFSHAPKFERHSGKLYQIDMRNAKDIHTYPNDYDYILIASYQGYAYSINVID